MKGTFTDDYDDFIRAYAEKFGEGQVEMDRLVAEQRFNALLNHSITKKFKEAGAKGGSAKNPNKGFGSNKELAAIAGKKKNVKA